MSSPPPRINVRTMISLYENQSFTQNQSQESLVSPSASSLKRAKSMGNVSRVTVERRSLASRSSELDQIEIEIQHIEEGLKKYQVYSKNSHIYYQNQLLGLLTDIVNIESNDDIAVINKKRTLISWIKTLSKDLNSLLPGENRIKLRAVPFQYAKEEEIETPAIMVTENDTADGGIPSVKKLRDLFERKSSETEDGLKTLVSPQRKLYSFSKSSCDISYIPYNEYIKSTPANVTKPDYVVESDTLPQRIVHKSSLHRSKSMKVNQIRSYFETGVKSHSLEELVDDNDSAIYENGNDSSSSQNDGDEVVYQVDDDNEEIVVNGDVVQENGNDSDNEDALSSGSSTLQEEPRKSSIPIEKIRSYFENKSISIERNDDDDDDDGNDDDDNVNGVSEDDTDIEDKLVDEQIDTVTTSV